LLDYCSQQLGKSSVRAAVTSLLADLEAPFGLHEEVLRAGIVTPSDPKLVRKWLTSAECDASLRAVVEKGGKHPYPPRY
jgi:hypothetical protein